MSNVTIALAALLLLCSLGLNVIQYLTLQLKLRELKGLRDRCESLKNRIARDELFHWRVQLAEEAFQESLDNK